MNVPELLPVTDDWEARWQAATASEFIRRKTDRTRRMREHMEYAGKWLDSFRMPHGLVVDIGPGCGELLELARAAGHDILGVDAPDGAGGMGDGYLAACRLIHERQRLPVQYWRFLEWIGLETTFGLRWQCAAINFRGSIEQAMAEHMSGEPHDVHHDAKQLSWREDRAGAITEIFRLLSRLLRPGGVLAIHENGAANREWFAKVSADAAERAGLTLKATDGDRMRVWVK